jgi:hypothetical protein
MNIPDPEMLASSFLCIQREIFVNVCNQFDQNVVTKNKSLYSRAIDFSKDFNNCDRFDFDSMNLTEDNYSTFCNYIFDFMNYVRKLDKGLFDESINYAKTQLNFSTFPTLQMSVDGCGNSIARFLELRENNQLDQFGNDDDNNYEDE